MADQQPQGLAVIPDVAPLKEYLVKRRDAAVKELSAIQAIATEEEYEYAEQICATAKKLYDAMVAKRKLFTDPIKELITEVMSYENTINYTAKTPNEYNRVRELLEQFNQRKIDAKAKAEHEAWIVAEQLKYKAEYKAKVAEELIGKVNGIYKNMVQQMADWERKLTLENADARYDQLAGSVPTLKREHYDSCFRRWGNRPDVMAPAQEDAYLIELKKELPYETYNEQWQQLAAPVKNEYMARKDHVKASLKMKAEADEATRKAKEAEEERLRQEQVANTIKAADERSTQQVQEVRNNREVETYSADFTQQAMTSDIEAGPSKKVARFADDKNWLPSFLKVVAKCAAHPKFKLHAKEGYVPEVKKFMDFYSANIGEAIDGLAFDEKAKTIVRGK